nr:hypothetical protein [Tanacetum cinerariifolium]
MNEYRECSSCGAWYTKSCACSKRGFAGKFVHKTPNSSQRPPQVCAKRGNPVDGHYCRHCALSQRKLKEVWFKICYEQIFSQDFLNTSESSNNDSNFVNAPQEPIVFNQCYYGCGDSLDGVFCRLCTFESCGNGAHISYNCPPKVLIVSNSEPCHNQNVDELPQTLTNFNPTRYSGYEDSSTHDSTPNFANDSPNDRVFEIKNAVGNKQYQLEDVRELFRKLLNDVKNIHEELAEYINIPSWNHPTFFSYDDENYTIAITPEELDNSLNQFKEFFDSNDDSTSIDDNYFSIDNIDYVEASPLDYELVSLEEVKDDNLREKLLNINLLIAKINSFNDSPTPDHVLKSLSLFPIPVEDSNSFLENSDTSLSYSDNS